MDEFSPEQIKEFMHAHGMGSSSDSYEGLSDLDDEYYRLLPSPIPLDELIANSVEPIGSNDNYGGECSEAVSANHDEHVTPSVNTSKSPPKTSSEAQVIQVRSEDRFIQFIRQEIKAEIDKLKDEYKLAPKVRLPDNSKQAKKPKKPKKQIAQDVPDGKCLINIKTVMKICNNIENAVSCLNAFNRKYSTNMPYEQQAKFDHIYTNLTKAEQLLKTILKKKQHIK